MLHTCGSNINISAITSTAVLIRHGDLLG